MLQKHLLCHFEIRKLALYDNPSKVQIAILDLGILLSFKLQ